MLLLLQYIVVLLYDVHTENYIESLTIFHRGLSKHEIENVQTFLRPQGFANPTITLILQRSKIAKYIQELSYRVLQQY